MRVVYYLLSNWLSLKKRFSCEFNAKMGTRIDANARIREIKFRGQGNISHFKR